MDNRFPCSPDPQSGSQNSSGKDVVNHPAMINLQPFAAGDFKTTIIEPQQVQHGRVKIGHVVAFAKRVVAKFVCFAVNMSLF